MLDRALALRVDGERVFDVVQATFNLLEPSLAGLLGGAHDAGLGVIAKEVHANGRLTDANDRPEDAALTAALRARANGRGLDQLALGFVLAHPFVDVALSGAATAAQLASHVAAVAKPLDDDTRAAVSTLAEPTARYWATRATLAWA